jgi:hypothetical protein
MNEVFETLGKKFPFLSLIRKGDLEYRGHSAKPRQPSDQLLRLWQDHVATGQGQIPKTGRILVVGIQ